MYVSERVPRVDELPWIERLSQRDVGDLDELPETVVQAAAWSDIVRAVREKPIDAER